MMNFWDLHTASDDDDDNGGGGGGGGGDDDDDDNDNDNEHKRAKRWTACLFSSSKPKPSELQLQKDALLRRTPRPCLGPAAAADLVGLAHQCHSSVLQEPFGRASRVGAPRASSDAPISPP